MMNIKVFYEKRNNKYVLIDQFGRVIDLIKESSDGVYTFHVMGYQRESHVYIGDY